jgi:hypothetical protein
MAGLLQGLVFLSPLALRHLQVLLRTTEEARVKVRESTYSPVYLGVSLPSPTTIVLDE